MSPQPEPAREDPILSDFDGDASTQQPQTFDDLLEEVIRTAEEDASSPLRQPAIWDYLSVAHVPQPEDRVELPDGTTFISKGGELNLLPDPEGTGIEPEDRIAYRAFSEDVEISVKHPAVSTMSIDFLCQTTLGISPRDHELWKAHNRAGRTGHHTVLTLGGGPEAPEDTRTTYLDLLRNTAEIRKRNAKRGQSFGGSSYFCLTVDQANNSFLTFQPHHTGPGLANSTLSSGDEVPGIRYPGKTSLQVDIRFE